MQNGSKGIKRWIYISFFSLLIVALLGVLMRYKISYSLPFIDQKKLLHAHSHFAFAGWITQVLMVLLVAYLIRQTGESLIKKYNWLLIANILTAYGMLFSFPVEGYGLVSITFSTLSIFVSYVFAIMFWKDLNRLIKKNTIQLWFKAALLFNAMSSLGAFALAGMMATKTIHQNWYLQGQYFFLHFQYNGWFFFACMGLLNDKLCRLGISSKKYEIIFWLFASACVPAYFLSVLWLPLPVWVYAIVILSAVAQLIGWILLINIVLRASAYLKTFPVAEKWLLLLSAVALSIKLLLQLGSTVPFLSHLAFGFRPIVIAYLHLVLLGVITLFILGYVIADNHVVLNKKMYAAIFIFTTGIILNETVLMIQGVSYINYVNVPYTNEMLLFISVIMLVGIFLLIFSQTKVIRPPDQNHISYENGMSSL